MTVVVAIKSGRYLQPSGRRKQFEPGIIMAGDTRLTYIGGATQVSSDGHVKVDGIGDFAIAGYAGNRDIATSVFCNLEVAIIQTGNLSPSSIVSVAQSMLVKANSSRSSLSTTDRRVEVLLGVRDINTNKFLLYEMNTDDGFEPHVRNGMASIGSHGHYVREKFYEILPISANLLNDPFTGRRINLKGELSNFVWDLLDKAIETAREVEEKKGNISFIGGAPHLVVLNSVGIEAMYPNASARLLI